MFLLLFLLPLLFSWLPRFPLIPASFIAKPAGEPIIPSWLDAAFQFEDRGAYPSIRSQQSFRWPFALWLGGVSFCLCRFLRSYYAVSKLQKKARSCSLVPLQLQRNVEVRVSESVTSPAAAGIFRQAVLVPVSSSAWTFQDWQIVLEHESEHIARRHALTKLLARVCCAMYWFHPLVWLAARRHSWESERVCDERVVSCGIDTVTYAATLVRFAEDRQKKMDTGIDLMGHSSPLERRVSALLGELPSTLTGPQKMSVVLFFLFAVFATIVIDPGWSENQRLAKPELFAALPRPNSVEDPYREPETELVINEDAPAIVSDPVLRGAPDRKLLEILRPLSLRVPRSREDYVAIRARWAIAQAKDGELIRPLLKRLDDPDWRIRAYAAYALGFGRTREAVPALIRCLDDPIWRMRAMAAAALTKIGDPIAARALRKSLSDPAWQVRVSAVPFFDRRPQHRSKIEPLQTDQNGLVREAAVETLRSMEN